MDETRLGAVEARFADIIWQNAPLSSGELVKLCAQALEWKKSTTYTVLKKLCVLCPAEPALCGGDLRRLPACLYCRLFLRRGNFPGGSGGDSSDAGSV